MVGRTSIFAAVATLGLTGAELIAFPGNLTPPTEIPELPAELRDQVPPPPPVDLPDTERLRGQLRMLDALLTMSPEDLQRLRQSIEMIERLSPEQRMAMRARLTEMRTPPPLPPSIAAVVQEMHPTRQRRLVQWWVSLTDDERTTVQVRLGELTVTERRMYLDENLVVFEKHLHDRMEELRNRAVQRSVGMPPAGSPPPAAAPAASGTPQSGS